MTSVAVTLAEWAAGLEPDREDLELAHRSLLDTVAVTLAARDHRVTRLAAALPDGARWAVAGHVLDFDDLHMPSTTHVSVVCVPTALRHGRRGAGLPGRGRGDGPAGHGAGLAALLGRVARHLHGRGAGRGGRGRGRAGPARRADRDGDGAGRARRGRGAARVRHRRQVAAGRLRGRGGASGRPGSRPRARRPTRPRWTCGWAWWAVTRPRWTRPDQQCRTGWRSSSTRAATRLQRPISALSGLSADPAAVRRIVLRTPEATVVPLIHHRPQDRAAGQVQPGVRGGGRAAGRPTPGSAASPTRRSAATRPGGWSRWSRPSSTRAATGCSTASSRPRCTPPTGPCCGPASSTRRVPRPGRRRRTSSRPSWPTAWPALLTLRPGRVDLGECGGHAAEVPATMHRRAERGRAGHGRARQGLRRPRGQAGRCASSSTPTPTRTSSSSR